MLCHAPPVMCVWGADLATDLGLVAFVSADAHCSVAERRMHARYRRCLLVEIRGREYSLSYTEK